MPVKRRAGKRREELDEEAQSWLWGDDNSYPYFTSDEHVDGLWKRHSGAVVEDWIADRPGSRPPRWWEREAPEQRQRMGGTGQPLHELGVAEPLRLVCGLPDAWATATWWAARRLAYRLPKPPGLVDPADLPIFESEAAYLDRLGLFRPGERRSVPPEDFRPVAIVIDAMGRLQRPRSPGMAP